MKDEKRPSDKNAERKPVDDAAVSKLLEKHTGSPEGREGVARDFVDLIKRAIKPKK